MRCRTMDREQFDAVRASLEQRRRYTPDEKSRTSVQFRFNLDPSQVGESLFVIYSNRKRSVMYRGPYQDRVTVEIDDGLTSEKGYDNLQFRLLRLPEKQSCRWVNTRGYPYWRPGGEVEIRFLRETTIDEKWLTTTHEVTIR